MIGESRSHPGSRFAEMLTGQDVARQVSVGATQSLKRMEKLINLLGRVNAERPIPRCQDLLGSHLLQQRLQESLELLTVTGQKRT